jgi:hypothetical protein
MTAELPSEVIADLVEDPHDNGTYRLLIEGAELDRLRQSVDRAEKELAHWKAVARYNQATSLPESSTWPVVLAFARKMEAQLQANMHKGGRENWLKDHPHELCDRLVDELKELWELIECLGLNRAETGFKQSVIKEAADVANFAMFIADACGGLEEVK